MSAALMFFDVRPVRASDHGFVVDTWRGTFEDQSRIASWLKNMSAREGADKDVTGSAVYRSLMTSLIKDLLAKTGTRAFVACAKDDDDTLLGYIVTSGDTLHYVYVRGQFRKYGVATRLIEHCGALHRYSFRTRQGDNRLRPDARGWKYQPFQMEIT